VWTERSTGLQNMRLLIVAISFLFVWSAPAKELVVTTWNLQWFPSGSSLRTSEYKETERIRQAVAILKSIDADIVLLQEVRDFATCHRLAKEVGSLKVAICSQFTEFGGKIGWQQIAILHFSPYLLTSTELDDFFDAADRLGPSARVSRRRVCVGVDFFRVCVALSPAPGVDFLKGGDQDHWDDL